MEWLTRADDKLDAFVPLELAAAASYQLGGLPAMASALLHRVTLTSPGERLYARFLQGNFDGVLRAVASFWRRHLNITDREAPGRLLSEEGDDKLSWFFSVELVRVLGALAEALRSGNDERFSQAMRKLGSLDQLATRAFNDQASMFISLLYEVATAYGKASIYKPVRRLSEINPARLSRLESFARTQFSRGRGILWTSQLHGLSRLTGESSFALCTPTGSGKTLVANLALVKELLLRADTDPARLALYLVPSRALAGEVEAKLSSELGHDVIVTGLYGGADWGITDYWLTADRPTVLIATVEKADALMRYLGPLLSRRLCLLILDEAHQVVPEDDERTQADFAEHSCRSLRLESFVSRLLAQAPDIVRIALTAVAGGAALPVARWMEGREDAEAIGTRYRSTRQLIGMFQSNPGNAGRMLLELLNGRPLFVRGREEPVYIRLRTPPMPALPAYMRNSIYRFNELDVLWTSLHLVADNRRILISVAQQPEQTMGWYTEALALSTWSEAVQFVPPKSGRSRALYDEACAACIDYCGEQSYELALLKSGIATSHGQMPQRLRRLMTDLIDRGVCPITVATATLTEGVNLPFDIIFVTSLKRRSYDPVNNQPIIVPLSTAEFRNLAGRAGRPGASNSMEGITLIAIPRRVSSTAPGQIPTQRRQLEGLRRDYRILRQSLLAEELEQTDVNSPLALLLQGIAERAKELLDLEGNEFLDWLETVAPLDVSDEAGLAGTSDEDRLADSVDELDGVLLSALEEIERLRTEELEGASAEAALVDLWRRSFSAYAATQEDWLEKAFVKRGQGILDHVYPDRDERARLYQYGFTPYVGRRFEAIAPDILEIIKAADDYGTAEPLDRLALFEQLGELLTDDRGFGFRVRQTETDREILENWTDVLKWWLQAPDAIGPEPAKLRAWQRFVSDNIEFRLGVAVGAVVARAWSDGAADAIESPTLDAWKQTTGLPWFGFWLRELVRWGTLDPFVAFCLSQGLARTREEGGARRAEFEEWLRGEYDDVEPEDLIDPQFFLAWQRSLQEIDDAVSPAVRASAQLVGTTGERGVYRVIPVKRGQRVNWLDAAGYVLARSRQEDMPFRGRLHHQDFELHANNGHPYVTRVFARR